MQGFKEAVNSLKQKQPKMHKVYCSLELNELEYLVNLKLLKKCGGDKGKVDVEQFTENFVSWLITYCLQFNQEDRSQALHVIVSSIPFIMGKLQS